MEEVCDACEVTVKGVSIANWATDLGPTTSAELTRNPEIDYVVPTFDPMTQFVAPAIQQAGKSGQIRIATINGNFQPMSDLADSGLVKVDVGNDLRTLGFIQADLVLRSLVGEKPVEDALAPLRIFDESNIDEVELSAELSNDGSWYAGTDVITEHFMDLWGR